MISPSSSETEVSVSLSSLSERWSNQLGLNVYNVKTLWAAHRHQGDIHIRSFHRSNLPSWSSPSFGTTKCDGWDLKRSQQLWYRHWFSQWRESQNRGVRAGGWQFLTMAWMENRAWDELSQLSVCPTFCVWLLNWLKVQNHMTFWHNVLCNNLVNQRYWEPSKNMRELECFDVTLELFKACRRIIHFSPKKLLFITNQRYFMFSYYEWINSPLNGYWR